MCKSSFENPIWSAKRVAEKNKIYLNEWKTPKTKYILFKDVRAQNVSTNNFDLKYAM